MDQKAQQEKKITVLKALNNAIVTSRLYPPEAPQVANTVERGYKGLKTFLREQGSLWFSLEGNVPFLCGQPLSKEVLDLFPNLIIYRQLKHLGLPHFIVTPEMDRPTLMQVIAVFNTAVDKIKKAGGGLSLITDMGLEQYFPEKLVKVVPLPSTKPVEPVKAKKILKVRQELLEFLCGDDDNPSLLMEINVLFNKRDSVVDLLAAGVGYVLQDIREKGKIFESPKYSKMLHRTETALSDENCQLVALDLARLLVESLRGTALCVLLSQDFSGGFGGNLYESLVRALSVESLSTVIIVFREQLAKARQRDGDKSEQVELLGKAMLRLMNTPRGKQFLGTEKARAVIHEGELERKKRRLESGLQGLLQGNIVVLKSDELAQYLPEAVLGMIEAKKEQELVSLLTGVAKFLDDSPTTSVLLSTIIIGEKLSADGRYDLLILIVLSITHAICKIPENQPLFEKGVGFLHGVMQHSWKIGENSLGDLVCTRFYLIRSGQEIASQILKEIVGRVQDRGIQRSFLENLLSECLEDPLNDILSQRLTAQGPVVTHYLVDVLIHSDKVEDRIKIIDMLTTNSVFLRRILQERLPQPMPWHGKRNIIKLLGEVGSEEDGEAILPYLKHDDLRVQREAFISLYKVAGKRKKHLFLLALHDSPEIMKGQIISVLGAICDQEIAEELLQVLVSHEDYSEKNRSEILSQALAVLGRCGHVVAQKGVEAFLQTRGQRATKKIQEAVWTSAQKALTQLEHDIGEMRRRQQHAEHLRKSAVKQAAMVAKGVAKPKVFVGLPQEQTIHALLEKGERKEAKTLLMHLIEKAAYTRNFSQADSLRDWLSEIDPQEIEDLLKAADIIDREKVASIEQSHLEIWSGLYDCLSSKEFASVYHAQKHRRYQDGDIIASQGKLQSALFFINSGKVKLYFQDERSEVVVKTLQRGEIFGAGAFFKASVWTISAASVGLSEISLLNHDKLKAWRQEFPDLETKLSNFCLKFEQIEDFVKDHEKDRRLEQRYKISGSINTTFVDTYGQSVGVTAVADVIDISAKGLSYSTRFAKKESARILLGRKVRLQLPVSEQLEREQRLLGDILAVTSNTAQDNDYSVHVRFDRILEQNMLQQIVGAMHGALAVQ